MMVERLINHVFRSSRFCKKLLACFDRLLTEVASPIKDLVDVEMYLQLTPQEGPEPSQDGLPQGVFLYSLLLSINFESRMQIIQILLSLRIFQIRLSLLLADINVKVCLQVFTVLGISITFHFGLV